MPRSNKSFLQALQALGKGLHEGPQHSALPDQCTELIRANRLHGSGVSKPTPKARLRPSEKITVSNHHDLSLFVALARPEPTLEALDAIDAGRSQ